MFSAMRRPWLQNAAAWLWRHKLVLLPLTVCSLLVAFFVGEHVRGKLMLAHYLSSLKLHGEKLSAEDFRGPSSPAENGAAEVLAAVNNLEPGIILPKTYPPRMRLTPAGHAVVCFREDQWVDGKVTNTWEELAGDLDINRPPLDKVRGAMR